MQQLASLRRRLDTAEDALAEAAVTMKRAETAVDAANDRFAAAEEVLDQARAERDRAPAPGVLTAAVVSVVT